MQTSQSFGIHFTTRPDKVKNGKEPIYACVTVNRQRAYIALSKMSIPKTETVVKVLQRETRKK